MISLKQRLTHRWDARAFLLKPLVEIPYLLSQLSQKVRAGVPVVGMNSLRPFRDRYLIHQLHLGTPIQKAAFAVITEGEGVGATYLLQWNTRWQMYNLVGGKLDNGRGDRNRLLRTIKREVIEELHLDHPQDALVSHAYKPVRIKQYSRREKMQKWYKFGVFRIDLYPNKPEFSRRRALSRLRSRNNRFVSRAEICQGHTWDKMPISPTTRHILCDLNILMECHSDCDSMQH